jgi:hypothetical protein
VKTLGGYFLFKPDTRPAVGELKKHVKELGRRFVFFDNNNFPQGNIYIAMREIPEVNSPYEAAEPRKHTVNSIMILLGKEEGLRGLRAELEFDNEKLVVDSPIGVFIYPNVLHTYKIIKGGGIYIKIVFAPNGDYNGVTI